MEFSGAGFGLDVQPIKIRQVRIKNFFTMASISKEARMQTLDRYPRPSAAQAAVPGGILSGTPSWS
jgi:hypothetical protein